MAETVNDKKAEDARIEREMRQHLVRCGISAEVSVTPIAGHPCRRRCAISSSADVEPSFTPTHFAIHLGDRLS